MLTPEGRTPKHGITDSVPKQAPGEAAAAARQIDTTNKKRRRLRAVGEKPTEGATAPETSSEHRHDKGTTQTASPPAETPPEEKKHAAMQPQKTEMRPRPTAAKAKAMAVKTEPKEDPTEDVHEHEPGSILAKLESLSPETAKAVMACLNRCSSAESLSKEVEASINDQPDKSDQPRGPLTHTPSPKPAQALHTPTPAPALQTATPPSKPKEKNEKQTPLAPTSPDMEKEEMTEEEYQRLEAQVKAKKEAHARYMRFKRSLVSNWADFQT